MSALDDIVFCEQQVARIRLQQESVYERLVEIDELAGWLFEDMFVATQHIDSAEKRRQKRVATVSNLRRLTAAALVELKGES